MELQGKSVVVSTMSLSALESIMDEFFSPGTTNPRKREIEEMLQRFVHEKDAWRQSLDFMAKTGNQHVCMFALNVIEVGRHNCTTIY